MKLNPKKFQEGGAISPEQAAAEQQGAEQQGQPQGGGPEEQIMQIAQQILQQLGPEGAAMLVEVLTQMLQQGAPQQQAPAYQKQGGRLVRVR